jgi:hypothetical protein
MAKSLTFEAFGKKFRTASTAAYILVRGPHTWVSTVAGQTFATEAHVCGYAYSGAAATKRRRREERAARGEVKVFSLSTGREVAR